MTKYHSNRTDCYFWLGASAEEAETGSREPGLASRPGPTGFDPARKCNELDGGSERCPRHGHCHWLTDEEWAALFSEHGG